VLQDAYFYWTHRAMHMPLLYRAFHRVHHSSTNPSPWTAYAFSVPEAVTHAAFLPLAWLVLPLQDAAVFVFLLFMVTRDVLAHLSIELFPSGFTRRRFLGWHTTATHHALHHKYVTGNFGLYFTLWDRWMGTTDARYETTFERVVARPKLPLLPRVRQECDEAEHHHEPHHVHARLDLRVGALSRRRLEAEEQEPPAVERWDGQ
jgi:Delta7-sterol 5-desaturase